MRARVVALAIVLASTACGGAQMGFDKARWGAERGNYDGESARGAMVAGLDDAGVVAGATRDAVRTLLGEPDSSGPAADIWFLGRSATGPDFDIYRVEYSSEGRVRTAGVRRG